LIDFSLQNVVIIWRVERNHLSYEWLKTALTKEEDIQDLRAELEDRVKQLLNSDKSLAYRTILPEFHNEHALVCAYLIRTETIKMIRIYWNS
jgi:hypothetical protein